MNRFIRSSLIVAALAATIAVASAKETPGAK
jgi:hypothetical protein